MSPTDPLEAADLAALDSARRDRMVLIRDDVGIALSRRVDYGLHVSEGFPEPARTAGEFATRRAVFEALRGLADGPPRPPRYLP